MIELIQGDCLEEMERLIDRGVKVDAIITDPPYGYMNSKKGIQWDNSLDWDRLWLLIEQLRKPKSAVVIFSGGIFNGLLKVSNKKNFKYEWIWDKMNPSNFLNANRTPLPVHEYITVFYPHDYHPIKVRRNKARYRYEKNKKNNCYSKLNHKPYKELSLERFPNSIIEISNAHKKIKLHPTEKPVKLLDYLIRTYTNPGDTVLDFATGSGTTGEAAIRLGRSFIGIELDQKYFEIAKKRIDSTVYEPELFEEQEIAGQPVEQEELPW